MVDNLFAYKPSRAGVIKNSLTHSPTLQLPTPNSQQRTLPLKAMQAAIEKRVAAHKQLADDAVRFKEEHYIILVEWLEKDENLA